MLPARLPRCSPRLAAHARRDARPRGHRRAHAAAAAAAATSDLPRPGDRLHGFTLKRSKYVPELDLTALHLVHDATGANHLHIARDDANNVFAIAFKTNPPDHTGVPHILEHSVLCGSERYPVRDPFFKMMPRSLQNFMNAFTSADHTTYPFATTNPQDFRNLMSVYLDATLHPLLKPQDFAQEGWRVGPADVPATRAAAERGVAPGELAFKGVVYNEMKGAMSSGDMLFAIRHRDHLFPAINNSGGIPQKITDLTHDGLRAFHAAHYHPSNALTFTYGGLPLAGHLAELAPRLERFERRGADAGARLPVELAEDMEPIVVPGPHDPHLPPGQQYKASVSLLMCDTSELVESFALGVVASLLIDGFASPLYQNTIGIGFGASYSSNTGLDASGRRATFSVGLNGLKRHEAFQLGDALRNTFLAVKRQGAFDRGKVEGRLHQIELDLKHKGSQFGMGLMSSLTESFFKGVDPLSVVAVEETLSEFRARWRQDGYLEGLFEKYFLSRKSMTFIMEPSEGYEADLQAEEAARLAAKVADISSGHASPEQASRALATQEFELQRLQEEAKTQDLSCLPSVHVSDIPRLVERKPLRRTVISDSGVQWREASTGGLAYFRGLLTLDDLPGELRPYLPLFSAAVHRLGTTSLPTEALEDAIKLKTGGVDVGYHAATSPHDLDACTEGIAISSHALDRNVPDMFELVRAVVQDTDFDHREAGARIGEIIKASAGTAVDDIADMGHVYARRFAEAGLTPRTRLEEEVRGLTQTRLVLGLASRRQDEDLRDVIAKLKAIQSFALAGGASLRCAVTCDAGSASANEAALAKFLSGLPQRPSQGAPPPATPGAWAQVRNAKSFFPLPYQVYYTAMSARTAPYASADAAPLQVLAQLLTHKRMHHEVREKGGAYGASASAAPARGTFSLASYRDPNPLNTLAVMRGAGAWARDRAWTRQELEEAKLCVFQSLDAPKSVDEEGMLGFLTGIDDGMEQQMRERLLDVQPAQVSEVAGRYLADTFADGGGANVAVLGKGQPWAGEAEGWTQMSVSAAEREVTTSGEGEGDDGYVVL